MERVIEEWNKLVPEDGWSTMLVFNRIDPERDETFVVYNGEDLSDFGQYDGYFQIGEKVHSYTLICDLEISEDMALDTDDHLFCMYGPVWDTDVRTIPKGVTIETSDEDIRRLMYEMDSRFYLREPTVVPEE